MMKNLVVGKIYYTPNYSGVANSDGYSKIEMKQSILGENGKTRREKVRRLQQRRSHAMDVRYSAWET